MKHNFSWQTFEKLPIVGILRGFTNSEACAIADAACKAGLTTIEVAMNTDGAVEQIAAINKTVGGDMNVGAGTVMSMESLVDALEAGASYIVTPVVLPEVIAFCHENEVPVFPGAFTPTEVSQAWTLGASMVKLFPADMLGPAYIKSLKAPLDDVKILATGGIRLNNVRDYLEAGADGFGVGTPLFDRKRMDAQDWAWMTEQVADFKKAFAEFQRKAAKNRKDR